MYTYLDMCAFWSTDACIVSTSLSLHVFIYTRSYIYSNTGSRGLWCSDSQPYVPTYSFCAKNSSPLIHPWILHTFRHVSLFSNLSPLWPYKLWTITVYYFFSLPSSRNALSVSTHRFVTGYYRQFPSKYVMQTRSRHLIIKTFIECTHRKVYGNIKISYMRKIQRIQIER